MATRRTSWRTSRSRAPASRTDRKYASHREGGRFAGPLLYDRVMTRKLIVANFQTLDGFYESADKTFHRFFDHFLPEYGRNDAFDVHNRDLLRSADTLILSGRDSFLGNKEYWTGVPSDPDATEVRRSFAELIADIEKVVVSD